MIILNPLTRKHASEVLATTLNAPYPNGLKDRIINEMLWAATCDDDQGGKDQIKYAQAYWSEGAMQLRSANVATGLPPNKGLRHEHLVPKNLIRKLLLDLKKPRPTVILDLLNRLNHAIIISTEEDQLLNANGFQRKMPPGFDPQTTDEAELFGRYIACSIPLYRATVIENRVLPSGPKLRFENGIPEVRKDAE